MAWWNDLYKIFQFSFAEDPLSKQDAENISGAGVTQPEAIPDIRQDGSYWGGGKGLVRLRDTNDFIDLSTVSNRQSRYKEYERLRNVAEIEMAMTVISDETCLSGATLINTPFDGLVTLKWLAENKKEEFLVYSWDFEKQDFTLAWAYAPRKVKTAQTVRVVLDNGDDFIATIDHRVLLDNNNWAYAGKLKTGDELKAFYRIQPDSFITNSKIRQFPRIYTHKKGWVHERQFIDEWRTNKDDKKYETVNKICRTLSSGMMLKDARVLLNMSRQVMLHTIANEGFSFKELYCLSKKEATRKVIGVFPHEEIDVYDLSVRDHENFCGNSVVFHNCQKNEKNHLFDIKAQNDEVKKELEFVFFNRKMWNIDRRLWSECKNLVIKGDRFWEVIVDPDEPKRGVLNFQTLPPDSMFRIETTKGKLIEFQQAKEGPDYESLTRAPVEQQTDAEIMQSRAIRFAPSQIIHFKIGDDRNTFYPYGVSLLEAARGPAHQLRLMEDAMVVYRLTRAPERRVFYIDVGQLPPFKAAAFINRMKDQFRKKKVSNNSNKGGASAVDERWTPPAADEDFWLPVRPNSNTRIDTLPGAQNLGEIDDAVYFRNKLYIAMNFPKNYFSTEDVQQTRISLSAQDVKFARMIERIQGHIEDGLMQLAETHLKLRGFPEDSFADLQIKMTPPSDWRELSRAEVVTNRINNATGLKSSLLYSDFDVLTKILLFPEDEAKTMMSRMKLQKLEDLKLQILASNPTLLGVGIPGNDGEQQMGAEPGGPNPMLTPDQEQPDQEQPQMQPEAPTENAEKTQSAISLSEPTADELRKYDLQIQGYGTEQDHEDIDYGEIG